MLPTVASALGVGCGHRVNTSVTAEENNCTYATNAGFFDMRTGDCMGNLVANRREIQVSQSRKTSLRQCTGVYCSCLMIAQYERESFPATIGDIPEPICTWF